MGKQRLRLRRRRHAETLWRLGLFLELPFDAGLPDGSTFTLQDDALLDARPVRPLPQLPPAPGGGLRAATGFHFKRAGLQASFGEALPACFPFLGGGRPAVPVRFSRSVVQITRIETGPQDRSDAAGGWVSDRFDAVLAQLNDFLVLLGQSAQDPHVRPVDRLDLPAVIPFLLSDVHANPGGEVRDEDRHLLILHQQVPFEAPTVAKARLDHAVRLLALHHSEGHPFLPFAEALLAARNALVHGRTRQAALDGGTAAEVLVNTVLRETAPLRGYTAEKTAKVVGSVGLKNQLREHVGPLLRTEVALDDPANAFGRWAQGAYALRNRVSHEGYRPTEAEAAAAIEDVRGLVDALAAAMKADELTRPVGDRLKGELA